MSGMDRRRFLKVTAITGTSAALAGCGNPEHQLMRFVPEEEITPGIAVWKPSVCPLCSAGCGVQARVMDGDAEVFRNGQPGITRMGLPRKLEGDREHPVSQGRLCVRGQAALQVTYHPDRLTAPLRRSGDRGSGGFQEISWDDALADLAGRIDALMAQGQAGAIGFLGRPRRGRRPALVAEFLQRLGAPAPVAFEFFDDAVCRRANALSFGRYQLPTFDLARSRYVIGFGADFLGTWNSPLAQNAAYGRMRGQQAIRTKFVQIEPRVSQTGASADEWLTVRPGTEGAVALGLAHVILRDGLAPASGAGRAGALVEGWAAGLPAFAPAEVEKRTGVAAARLEGIAREFAAHRPSVAIIGGAGLAHANGLDQALAVNALNALVGSVEVPGGVTFMPTAIPPAPPARSLRDLLAAAPATQLLLVDEANPVFAAPPAWKAAEALGRIPFIVSFGSFLDDTSVLADLVLPDHSFLEGWTESHPESGAAVAVATTVGPAMKPLYTTRAMPDVLLDVGRRLKQPLDPPLPWQSFEEMLQAPAPAAPAAPARPVRRRGGPGESLGRAAFRRRRRRVSVPLPALRVAGALRRLAGSPAVAAGAARPDDHRDVVVVGRAERPHGRGAGCGRRRPGRRGVGARYRARPGRHLARHRARCGRDAGRAGARDVHALRQRARRQSDSRARPDGRARDRHARLGRHPRESDAGGRRRRQPDSLRRRDPRAPR